MNIKLRDTLMEDLDYVIESERKSENAIYVGQWTEQEHMQSLLDLNIGHYIIENFNSGEKIGYIILSGLLTKKIIEIKRIVINIKNKGYGKSVLEELKKICFEEYKAHRLWLDVRMSNERGKYIYKKVGFKEEGILRDSICVEKNYESLMVLSILESEYKKM